MTHKVIALVLAGGRVDELLCLTEKRAKAALPIFGTYRIIDFVLSNLMHSGIENVGILSQYRPHDLMRHVGTGEHWDFIGRKRGIRILPPYSASKGTDWYKGTADAVYQNMAYIDEFKPEHVLIASADHVYRMDYKPFIQFHIQNKAYATICFTRLKTTSARFGYGVIDNKGHLINYIEKPKSPPSAWISMTLYIFKSEYLADVLATNARMTSHEFGKDIIPKIIPDHRVLGFRFEDYWAYARTVQSYYDTNMDLLNRRINLKKWQVRTNQIERSTYRDRLPAYINGGVVNSVISDGCIIKGRVENSILAPGVKIGARAEVIDSIVFHDTTICYRAKLKKVICDQDSYIDTGAKIGGAGQEIPSKEFGTLLGKGITIIGRETIIAKNVTIGANTVIYPSLHITKQKIEPGSTIR